MMKGGPEVDRTSPPLPPRPTGACGEEKRDKKKGNSGKRKKNRRSQAREAEELLRVVTPPPPEPGTIDIDLVGDLHLDHLSLVEDLHLDHLSLVEDLHLHHLSLVEDLHLDGLAALMLDSPLPIIQPMKTLWSEQVEGEEETGEGNELLIFPTSKVVFKDDAEIIPVVHNTPSPELQRHPKPMKSRVRERQSWPLPAATNEHIKRARVVEPPVYRDSLLKFFSLGSGPFGPTTGVRAKKLSVDSLRCSGDWMGIEMVKFGPSVRRNIRYLGKKDLIRVQNSSTLVIIVENRPIEEVAIGNLKEPVDLAIFRHNVTGWEWCRCMSRTSDREVCLFDRGTPLSKFVRTQSWGQHMS